jgi:salicylate hydroxylase
MLTFPINHGQTMNVVAFHTTEDEWSDSNKLTKPAAREDALRDFERFGDNVRNVLKLAEPELDVVSIFTLAHRDFILIHSSSGPSSTSAQTQFHHLIRV